MHVSDIHPQGTRSGPAACIACRWRTPLKQLTTLLSHSAFAGYSFWTNSVYRAPLVFSGLSCLVGNLVLCLSYDTKLLPLLYIARLVTGVGAS